MKVIVFGHRGQLGIDLMKYAQQKGLDAVGVDLPECDITRKERVDQVFSEAGPVSVAINAAAYTAVDQAESEPEIAFAVNRDGVENLAIACSQLRIPLIHISTDYVFSGNKTMPYKPDDSVDPCGVYGQSKAQGEAAVRARLDRHIILRISWLVGLYGDNFVKTMLRIGKERDEIQVVDDQIGSPTYAGDLAAALFKMAEVVSQDFTQWGTYHYCNQGALTWYAFARKIFAFARAYEKHTIKEIVPILTEQYPLPAPRPQYSVLDCTRFDETFGIARRPWDLAMKEMIRDLYAMS